MEIHCIADLHGHIPRLPGGDMLIVAGDISRSGHKGETIMFFSWLDTLPYEHIIIIAGNHDRYLTHGIIPKTKAYYLINSFVEVEGIKIWGSPYTPKFQEWYFGNARGEQIRKVWDQIPADTDILVTHGPPRGILDKNVEGKHCGCEELRKVVDIIKPKFHIFGHIHEEYGEVTVGDTRYVNCSYLDEKYNPQQRFQTINYDSVPL